MKRLILLLLAAMPLLAQAGQHTVTATFNYDFTVDNSCSSTVTTGCLKQFNIYDDTNTSVLLFSIPAPGGATTAVSGITGTSSALTLKAGLHTFGATAAMSDGTESIHVTVTAVVKPVPPSALTVTVK